ncbi:MAG: DUF3791 domain-containing protein [Deltaproteobacteria bacterium]|jgi:hypothetical protein|nr:DUF3791 domain-containing protein [Deltaproteobacteria bacterium]
MAKIKDEVLFLSFCVEIYKMEKKISGQDAFNYLYRTGATDFIVDCYDGLHVTGHLYIIDCIDDYIKNNDQGHPLGLESARS